MSRGKVIRIDQVVKLDPTLHITVQNTIVEVSTSCQVHRLTKNQDCCSIGNSVTQHKRLSIQANESCCPEASLQPGFPILYPTVDVGLGWTIWMDYNTQFTLTDKVDVIMRKQRHQGVEEQDYPLGAFYRHDQPN